LKLPKSLIINEKDYENGVLMPRRTPKVKKLLSQLSKKELLTLAKIKKLHEIPKSWSKGKIVDALCLYISTSDVTKLVSKKSKAKTAEGRGYEARERGAKLERKVASQLRNRGYKCKTNVRIPGAEFDVIAVKEGGWFSNDEWIFAECKNKPKVVPADFKKFLGNFRIFCRKRKLDEEEVEGIFYTTGIFDPLVKKQAREFSNVKLKRVRI
jgi:IS1 family transposase